MSNLEKVCICTDDDLTTSIMFKFCIADQADDWQYIYKYQYRMVISVIVDCIIFPMLLLGADKFRVETSGMIIGLIMFGLSLMAHLVCYCKLERLKGINPGPQGCLMGFSLMLLILECLFVFLCSLSRCMIIDIQEYTLQDDTSIQAEVQFRSFNFYAGSLAYVGYVVGIFSITRLDASGKLEISTFFYVIMFWMFIDLVRLSWFCLKSIKKSKAIMKNESDPNYKKPEMKGNKYTYQQPQSIQSAEIQI